ncbi:MAG: hypothetical protein Q8R04_00605 [Nanoarchaeota archaeon]|nr:hypothetical protein [Nanoarchaeota archaeon]
MFDILKFFKKEKPTEEDILTKFITPTDSVLVVGPYDEYGTESSIPILLKKIKNKKLTIIGVQGDDVKSPYPRGGGDLIATRDTIKKVSVDPIKYVFSDALLLSFKEETFDVIVDRITHQFILSYNTKGEPFNQEFLDKLIFEYNRTLKKNGRLIFFSTYSYPINAIKAIKKGLKMWGYKLTHGRLKRLWGIKIEEHEIYQKWHPDYYIVGIKT